MRFLFGLALGLALGAAAVLLLPPQPRGKARPQEAPPLEELGAAVQEDHDLLAMLRRVGRSLQRDVEEAWREALSAAEEAEREMRARYQRMARRVPPGRE